MISIIIPVYNEAPQLPKTLQALAKLQGNREIIAVDGGSQDDSVNILDQHPDIQLILCGKAERAAQMNAGAAVAKGNVFWFLHADTLIPEDSLSFIEKACQGTKIIGGSCRLFFDRQEWPYRLLAFFTRFNSPFWTFGDQGIFVKKESFEQVGGYAAVSFLEDLEFQLRLRKLGDFIKLPISVTTSARRYHQGRLWREFFLDLSTVFGYFLGVPVEKLKQRYQSRSDWFPTDPGAL